MLRKTMLAGILVGVAAGCGRGTYDDKLDSAIRNARNPPAPAANEEAGDEAAKEEAAKEEPMADAPKEN